MGYSFYIDGMLLPVTPGKLSVKINNQNKTMTLINEGMINILKTPGLTDVKFEALLPNVRYPFAVYNGGFQRAATYLNKLKQLKEGKSTFQFVVTREMPSGGSLSSTNITVSLEDYEIKEDAGKDGLDMVVSVNLKQFRPHGTKTIKVRSAGVRVIKISASPQRETSKAPSNSTYTVKDGDCLWNIAKKVYGDGSKYTLIAEANKDKIKNPNLIYTGQTFTIPKI